LRRVEVRDAKDCYAREPGNNLLEQPNLFPAQLRKIKKSPGQIAVRGLLAYGPNIGEMFKRCGSYVGKVLHVAKPNDLPIQRPEKFDLVINLTTAKALGLEIPSQLKQLADEVIE
jgi:ABC-type uncharacterized transport system substrate-binding protein